MSQNKQFGQAAYIPGTLKTVSPGDIEKAKDALKEMVLEGAGMALKRVLKPSDYTEKYFINEDVVNVTKDGKIASMIDTETRTKLVVSIGYVITVHSELDETSSSTTH